MTCCTAVLLAVVAELVPDDLQPHPLVPADPTEQIITQRNKIKLPITIIISLSCNSYQCLFYVIKYLTAIRLNTK